jgi:hypothetical protein
MHFDRFIHQPPQQFVEPSTIAFKSSTFGCKTCRLLNANSCRTNPPARSERPRSAPGPRELLGKPSRALTQFRVAT